MLFSHVDWLWKDAIDTVKSLGSHLDSRDGGSQEVIGYSATLNDIRMNFVQNPVRKLCPHYANAELLWYLSMTDDITMLLDYAPSYKRFAVNGRAYGAYGERWANSDFGAMAKAVSLPCKNQLEGVIKLLRDNPNTRQAVMSMWRASDLAIAVSGLSIPDLPCTLNHQFFLRDGELHMVTTMRSNDVWMGMPYDIYCNTMLLIIIADCLDVKPGTYTHNVGSLHIYDRHAEKCSKALSAEYDVTIPFCTWQKVDYTHLRSSIKSACSLERQFVKDSGMDSLPRSKSIWEDIAYCCGSKFYPGASALINNSVLREAVQRGKD